MEIGRVRESDLGAIGELERFARDRSCNQMILLTESCREDAAALYRSNGFADRWTGFKKKL